MPPQRRQLNLRNNVAIHLGCLADFGILDPKHVLEALRLLKN